MRETVLYIHGKGGSASESEHYRPLFPNGEVVGLDYKTFTPWETGREIREAAERLARGGRLTLIANSIGAYFAMNAGLDGLAARAYFISPIVDMERLIRDMMALANVTEGELKDRGTAATPFGETLSWEYLRYVREHPIKWRVPTEILYASGDTLTSYGTVRSFADTCGARLTVMEGGEHWFHTPEQLKFVDEWIVSSR